LKTGKVRWHEDSVGATASAFRIMGEARSGRRGLRERRSSLGAGASAETRLIC
jgi:hypothetical protein